MLNRHRIPAEVWDSLLREVDIFTGLSAVERAHLRELATLFLHSKTLSGVKGLVVTVPMAVAIAAQACLLVLKLGLDYYDGWKEVVIYPGAFRISRDQIDATGLVSHKAQTLSGEAWIRGPLILSWAEVAAGLTGFAPGRNVVVHEFAHKLDMLNGSANGMPILHQDMVRQQWTAAFSAAYEHLQQQLAHHARPDLNPYGATSPAEFFAVTSEYFFTDPQTLRRHYPAVYAQLELFYRQDPTARRGETGDRATDQKETPGPL